MEVIFLAGCIKSIPEIQELQNQTLELFKHQSLSEKDFEKVLRGQNQQQGEQRKGEVGSGTSSGVLGSKMSNKMGKRISLMRMEWSWE